MRAWPVGGDGARPDSTEVGESCWNGTAGGMPVGDSGVSCRQDTVMGVEAISAVTAVTGTAQRAAWPGTAPMAMRVSCRVRLVTDSVCYGRSAGHMSSALLEFRYRAVVGGGTLAFRYGGVGQLPIPDPLLVELKAAKKRQASEKLTFGGRLHRPRLRGLQRLPGEAD